MVQRLLALILAICLSAVAGGASAADGVTRANLVSVSEASAAGYDASTRRLYFDERLTTVRTKNCIGLKDGSVASGGVFADYLDGRMQPLPEGQENLSEWVLKFPSRVAARLALGQQRDWINRCSDGEPHSFGGSTVTLSKIALPDFGDQRIGFRETEIIDWQAEGTPDSYLNYRVVWVREGRFLVQVIVRRDGSGAHPIHSSILSITRKALARVP